MCKVRVCRWWSAKICPLRHPRSCWGVRVSFTPAGQSPPRTPAGHTAWKLDVGGGLRDVTLYTIVSVWSTKSESCSGFIVQAPVGNNSQQLCFQTC